MRAPLLSADKLLVLSELAESIADEYCPSGAVVPEDIIRRVNLTFSYGRYGAAFDGMLEWDGVSFHVYCNVDRTEGPETPRSRFTLGHELGHYFIDEHRNALTSGVVGAHLSKCEFQSVWEVEREADEFAAALLMPRRRFAKAVKQAERGLGGVLALARQFRTSLTSTAIKYVRTVPIPCTLVKWDPSGYGWRWTSSRAYEDRFGRTIQSLSQLIPDSATSKALSGAMAPPCGFFETGSTASRWFNGIAASSERDVVLREQAVSLGRFGALTLLITER